MAAPREEIVASDTQNGTACEEAGQSTTVAEDDARGLVNTVISDRYRVVELIATGGTSSVYLGQHVHMLKEVAIKVLDPNAERLPELIVRFQREAIAGAHVHHPNIASAVDFGQLDDGSYFLVLEYVRGVTLDKIIAQGPMAVDAAVAIARQLAEALAAAHLAGVVHRDLKPRNVMYCDEPRAFVKLIDFGFAHVRMSELIRDPRLREAAESQASSGPEKELTGAGIVLGTVAYMAPEAALGMRAVDARSDMYALGIILYELLTGEHPFDAVGPVELFLQQCQQPPPPMAERKPGLTVPASVEALVMKLLAKDPVQRYQTADELGAALAHAQASTDVPSSAHETAASQSLAHTAGHAPARSRAKALGVAEPLRRIPQQWRVPAAAVALLTAGLLSYAGARSWRASTAHVGDASYARRRESELPGAQPGASDERVPYAQLSKTDERAPDAQLSATGERAADAHLGPLGPTDNDSPLASATAPEQPWHADPADPQPREVALEVDGLDAWAWRMNLRNAARERDVVKGARAVRALLRLDPAALRELDLQVAARNVAVALEDIGGDPSTKFFAALTNEHGAAGLDVLYDVARQKPNSKAGRWATEILRLPEVLARASAPLRVLFEFRESSCAAKRDLFVRMSEQGDERALAELQGLRDADCARRRDPCCYRDHAGLAAAIRALRARLVGPPLK